MEVEGSIAANQVEEMGDGAEGSVEVEGERRCTLMTADGHDDAKFVGAALIPEVVHSPTRASTRLAGVAAEHTLVWAERLVQSRNLECNKGNNLSDPSCFLPLSNTVDNLRALGLGVGINNGGSFKLSVQNLVEDVLISERPCSVSGVGEGEFSDTKSVDSDSFERRALEFLCGDLMEEVFDDDSYHLSSDLKTVKWKPGAKSSRKRASRKLKVRINKISTK